MKDVHIVVGVATIAVNGAAAVWGAVAWWRARVSTWFWRVLRGGQVLVVIQAALGGVLVILGHKPSGLHVLYGLLPILISLLAEQLRIGSAQLVLDSRGLRSAADVGKLPAEEQRVVAMSILLRETGVMASGALVIVVLLARAAMTAS